MVAITQPRLRLELVRPARPARTARLVGRRLPPAPAFVLGAALVLAALRPRRGERAQAESPSFGGEPAATVTYVVEPGDTVWSIAAALAPDADPRPLVDEIVDANGGASLDVGQRLELRLP